LELTLTFDNGPTDATPRVLDLLAEYGVRSTFFVLGRQMADPALRRHTERAASEGHWIGNHTFSHAPSLGDYTDLEASVEDVRRAQALIGDLAHPDRLFRPYANSGVLDRRVFNRRVVEYLEAERYTVVLWNAVPRDWQTPTWVDIAIEQCRARPWGLMVLHDAYGRALPGLERFLALARDAGVRFRQDFPPECLAMTRGVPAPLLDPLIAPPAGGA
jgi:peptidoglycan/xylan/chitin deacetylase (PgdA/CDA1 family)